MDRTACTEPQCLYKGALYTFTVIGTYVKLTERGGCCSSILRIFLVPPTVKFPAHDVWPHDMHQSATI